jgi:CheY-like chemotaxis protein
MKKLQILIVDDDTGLTEFLSVLFRTEGWDATVAQNGIEGVQLASERRYDVILMDYLMPRMDGVEATKRIITADPQAKVIFITGMAYGREAQDAIQAGAKLFLEKPICVQSLLDEIIKLADGK